MGPIPMLIPIISLPLPLTLSSLLFVCLLQIWWTALSVALGLDVRGDVIKGVPCIKRYHQLFCPTAGNSYPMYVLKYKKKQNKNINYNEIPIK